MEGRLNNISKSVNQVLFHFYNFLSARNPLDKMNLTLNINIQLLPDLENAFVKFHISDSPIIKVNE